MSLEDHLKLALRREEPPAGFAERVLAAADAREVRNARAIAFPARSPLLQRWLAVAAGVVLMIGAPSAIWQYQKRDEEERQARAAREQLYKALQVTGAKLHRAQLLLREKSQR